MRYAATILLLILPLLACENPSPAQAEDEMKKAEVGKPAPGFTLTDIEGTEHSLSEYEGKLVVLEWVNHGCPFVRKHYDSGNMQELQKTYTDKGVVWLTICSSAKGKQGYHTAEEWASIVEKKKAHPTAVCLDTDGTVGHLYGARTTPHMYVIDKEGTLLYAGAIDSIRSTDVDDIEKAENYVTPVLDKLLKGEKVEPKETKPYGCSVKYK